MDKRNLPKCLRPKLKNNNSVRSFPKQQLKLGSTPDRGSSTTVRDYSNKIYFRTADGNRWLLKVSHTYTSGLRQTGRSPAVYGRTDDVMNNQRRCRPYHHVRGGDHPSVACTYRCPEKFLQGGEDCFGSGHRVARRTRRLAQSPAHMWFQVIRWCWRQPDAPT